MAIGNISRILAIDPGESTGISYIESGHFRWGMVCKAECFDSEDFILGLVRITKPSTIVIESPPTRPLHYNQDQYRIYEVLVRIYSVAGFNVIKLNPGQWKKLIDRTDIDGAHMRDAADMGRLQHIRETSKNG